MTICFNWVSRIRIVPGLLELRIISISLFLFLTLSSSFAQSFKPGSEPRGFRDIPWGTELSTLQGMKYERTSEMGGSLPVELWDFDQGKPAIQIHVEIYLRTEDERKIGNAELRRIEYGFRKGKLCEVTLTTRGSQNWASLRKTVFETFGKGRTIGFRSPFMGVESLEGYVWLGKTAEMELTYRESSQTGKLWIGSTVLRKQIFSVPFP